MGCPVACASFTGPSFDRNAGPGGAARTNDPNSADSQFFICLAPAPSLDTQYTIWGQVTSGMEFVDKIKKGSASMNGAVQGPDKIVRMQVAADVK